MADTIRFEIVTPTGGAWAGAATSVVLPSSQGELEILPGHQALLALIGHGTVIVTQPDGTRVYFVVDPGYVEVADDKVVLLVSVCTGADDVDVDAARGELESAGKALSNAAGLSEAALAEERERAERARARLEMIERATGNAQR